MKSVSKSSKLEQFQSNANHSRWKWMSGAAAAAGGSLAAGTASAALVQITLPAGNEVTTTGIDSAVNTLDPDVTGDGKEDLDDLRAGFRAVATNTTGGYVLWNFYVSATYALAGVGGRRQPFSLGSFTSYSASVRAFSGFQSDPQDKVDIDPVTFSDSRINGGVETTGFLEVRAFNTSLFSSTVRLVRLVFNDAEPFLPSSGVVAGGTNTEWGAPDPATIAADAAKKSRLSRKVKKLKGKLKKLKRKGNSKKVKKLKAKIKKAQNSLRDL